MIDEETIRNQHVLPAVGEEPVPFCEKCSKQLPCEELYMLQEHLAMLENIDSHRKIL